MKSCVRFLHPQNISGPSEQNSVQLHPLKNFNYIDITEITEYMMTEISVPFLALWYSCSMRDLWVGSVALQRLSAAHAAQMTFSMQASKDSAGYSSSILRFQCSLTQDATAPGFLWHLTQVNWSVVIDLEA